MLTLLMKDVYLFICPLYGKTHFEVIIGVKLFARKVEWSQLLLVISVEYMNQKYTHLTLKYVNIVKTISMSDNNVLLSTSFGNICFISLIFKMALFPHVKELCHNNVNLYVQIHTFINIYLLFTMDLKCFRV